MLFPVTSGFVFQQVDLSAVLEDKIQIPEFFLIVVTKNHVFGSNGLRKDIFQETACIDADFSLQQRDLKVSRAGFTERSCITQKQLEEAALPVQGERSDRGRHIEAGKSHSGFPKPQKAVFIPLHPGPLFQSGQDKPADLAVELCWYAVKNCPDFVFSVLLAYLAISDL